MDCHFIERITRISMRQCKIPFHYTNGSELLEELSHKNVTSVTCYLYM